MRSGDSGPQDRKGAPGAILDEIDADAGLPDQDFTSAGRTRLDFSRHELLRATVLLQGNCARHLLASS
jgi:hypothetical protein